MNLPETTTDRLLAVADIIDLTPERWDQAIWVQGEPEDIAIWLNANPSTVAGQGRDCATRACVAGWAVALTPLDVIGRDVVDWEWAGAIALGLDGDLAEDLFRATLPLNQDELTDVLRRLAKLPEGERDYEGAKRVLDEKQYFLLCVGGEPSEDEDEDDAGEAD